MFTGWCIISYVEILTTNTIITIVKLCGGVGLDHEVRSLMNASVPSIKETPKTTHVFLTIAKTHQTNILYAPGKRILPLNKSAGNLILVMLTSKI